MDEKERELRERLTKAGRELLEHGLLERDGNLSVRLPNSDQMLITPAGVKAGQVTPEMLVVVDFEGKVIRGELKPSSGVPMHKIIYNLRPDVQCVIHSHSPFATAFAVAGMPIPYALEIMETLGGAVPCAEYAPLGTELLAQNIGRVLGQANAVLLKNHGVLVAGQTIELAVKNVLTLEKAAQIVFYAQAMGSVTTLPQH
ncbi:MAG: class II aldolase/adducin family protein [Chloroflexi bacterium]|nr:class II aldolase/adducin family protein [Chloroflexota bacterium]